MKISSMQQQQQSTSSTSSSSSTLLPSTSLTKTRVCLRNIPPNWDETKLQQFLQSKSTQVLRITDCTILRHHEKNRKSRQVAFVGLTTPEQASHVVQFFHRTYCLSQKLIVEYARQKQTPTLESQQEQEQLSSKKDTTNHHHSKQQQQEDNPTKQEFMKQYSTTSKPKFWANDDADGNVHNVDNTPNNEDPFVSIPDTPMTTTPPPVTNSEIVISDLDFLRSKACTVKDDLDSDDDDKNVVVDDDNKTETISIAKQHDTVVDDQETSPQQQQQKQSTNMVRNESTNDNTNIDNVAILQPLETSDDPNRLFVRNLSFGTTLDDLHQLFEPYGSLQDCHIPVDDQKRSKGFAFVTFDSHHDANRALHELDGTDWKGRFLHIHIARRHPTTTTTPSLDRNTSHPTWKVQQETIKNQQQTRTHQGWSANLVRGDAVVDTMAARLGISAADILNLKDGHSGDAAVRVALGETQILEENRQFFAQHGVDMEALVSTTNRDDWKRSQTMILVKNLPFPTEQEELVNLFGKVPTRILLPPSRTIALVEFGHAVDAKRAFKKLAYKRFKHVPLYLEWAPLTCQNVTADTTNDSSILNSKSSTNPENEEDEIANSNTTGFSIYIQNLHFDTTEQDLQRIFTDAQIPIRAVRIPRKVAPRKAGTDGETAVVSLSMGYGFVECDSEESVRTAIAKLQGVVVHDHAWQLQRSTHKVTETRPHPFGEKTTTTSTQRQQRLPTKLVCRNVPFQATRKELIQLFGSTHVLKKVRLPTKFDGNHRGFAFIEFSTHADAEAAKKSLSRTHLYGRHLVLEWAEEENDTVTQNGEDDENHTNQNLTALRNKAKRDMAKLDLDVAPNKRKKISR